LPQAADYGFGVIMVCDSLRTACDHQRNLASGTGSCGPLPQVAQRAGTHFVVDFSQLAHEHCPSLAENVHQLLQRRFNSPRGFKNDEREADCRGAGNQPQALCSLSGQESKRQERAVAQS